MLSKDKYYLCQLILKFKDQTITPQELELLDKAFQRHPESIELLTQIIEVHTQLNQFGGSVLIEENNEILSDKVWQVLADEENKAPIVEIPFGRKEPRENVKTTEILMARPRINKFSLYSLLLSAAALIFMIVYAHYAPPKSGYEVAILTDSIQAKWADPADTAKIGTRLLTNQGLAILKEGIIQMRYDDGVLVVIEAPAEYELLTSTEIAVNYGRLYATVSNAGKGFTVKTQNTRIIDLGTEFGVEADARGDTFLHVTKGKTTLIAGEKYNKVSMEVSEGSAKKISSASSEILDIPCNKQLFARAIDSRRNVVWKGQLSIDLADIVGGGCGLGDGHNETAIDPLTGQMLDWKRTLNRYGLMGDFYRGQGQYVPVSGSAFIDGVFVPDGGNGPIQVTSVGHRWNCPDTSNFYKYDIVNSLHIPDNPNQYNYDYPGLTVKEDMMLIKASEGQVPVRLLGLIAAKTPPNPTDTSLFMHANLGITFDLSQIRKVLPDVRITKFKSVFGMGELATTPLNLDLWILVDGKPRLIKQNADSTTAMNIEMDLSQSDRFLTLVVTDGGSSGYAFDWGLFMNPRLEIE
jgi:hypothetical protein